MSFMQGFGEGFSRTFNQTLAQNHERKQDAFRLFYNDYLDRKKERSNFEQEDTKRIKQAKALVEGTGLPEGTWVKAYEWLDAGLPQDEVIKRLSTGTFGPSDLPAGQTNPAVMETQKALGQEGIQGPVPGASPQPQVPPQQPQAVAQVAPKQSFIQDILNKDEDPNKYKDYALGQIGKYTGLPPEAIDKVLTQAPERSVTPEMMAGMTFTPGPQERDLPQTVDKASAIYDRAKRAFDTNPSAINKKRMEDALTDLEAMKKPSLEVEDRKYMNETPNTIQRAYHQDKQKYEAQKVNTISMLRRADDMTSIIKQKPEALAEWTAGAASLGVNLVQNIDAAIGLFKDSPNAAFSKVAQLEKQYQNEINKYGAGKNIMDLETAKRLLDMNANIMAYNIGIAYGQDGRSFAEAERKMFIDMLKGGSKDQTFFQNLSLLVNGEVLRVKDVGDSLRNNSEVLEYNERFPNNKMALLVDDIFDSIEVDPKAKKAMEFLAPYNNNNIGVQQQEQQNNIPEGYTPIGRSPDGKIVYRAPDGSQVTGE